MQCLSFQESSACLGWDGRPFIVQRKLIYTWKLERASAGSRPASFDLSAAFSSGLQWGFSVVIHLRPSQCLLSPSLLCACLSSLPHSSPVPCAMGEVYVLYLLATAVLRHPQGSQSKVGPLLKFSLPVAWERCCFLGGMPSPMWQQLSSIFID